MREPTNRLQFTCNLFNISLEEQRRFAYLQLEQRNDPIQTKGKAKKKKMLDWTHEE